MTEEEAENKWCPMVHYRQTVMVDKECTEQQILAAELTGKQSRCIASGCMMWVPELEVQDGKPIKTSSGRCGLVK